MTLKRLANLSLTLEKRMVLFSFWFALGDNKLLRMVASYVLLVTYYDCQRKCFTEADFESDTQDTCRCDRTNESKPHFVCLVAEEII